MFGKAEIFGKSTNIYNLIGINENNIEIDLTPSATFSIISETTASFNGNVLSIPNIITEEAQIIKAECTYKSIHYESYFPIYIKPLQILQFYIDGPYKISGGEEKEFTVKCKCKNGDILDLTNNCTFTLSSENCEYRIENNKLKIKCNKNAENEVCIINATFLDSDTSLTYFASKLLYVLNNSFNTFQINFQFTNEDQKRMITYDSNYLFSLGHLDTGDYNQIKFKTLLLGLNNIVSNEPVNVEIYEIGSSLLNIEDEDEQTKKISLKSNTINEEKEIILLFVYNDSVNNLSISKSYSIKIFSSTSVGENIKSLRVDCSKYIFNNNDSGNYFVYGLTYSGDEINITNLCTVEIKTPISGVSINNNSNSIITTTLSDNAAGYLKVSYNNLKEYLDVYFIKN